MKPFLFSTLGIFAAVYLVMAGWLYFNQRGILYIPYATQPSPAEAGFPDMDVVEFETADGLTLYGWYKQAVGDKPTVVYFHGNAGNLLNHSWIARPLLDAGYGVLLVEYRGFGGNPGLPGEAGLYQDARAGFAFLRAEGVSDEGVVLYGESLGAGVAVQIAQGRPLKTLVLEAPFTSLPEVGARHYPYLPVRLLSRDRYDNLAKIVHVEAPLIVVHGDDDEVVPHDMGQRLLAAAETRTFEITLPGANHGNVHDHGAADRIMEIISGLDR